MESDQVFRRLTGILAGVLVAALALAGCAGSRNARFVQGPGDMRPSPSGEFVATVVDGPLDDGVKTWVVIITDSSGAEVFRDTDSYSTRHGVGITWLSTADELWILSADAGTSRVARVVGTWTKTRMTPETITQIPDEIKALQ